jgi:hypothetical protein
VKVPGSRRARIVTALAAALCAAGSLAAYHAAATAPRLPAITVHDVTSESQIRLPVDSYAPAFSSEALIGRAVTKLADACLARHGVAVPPVFLGSAEPPPSVLNDSTVQWLSVASARRYGFNPPQDKASAMYQDTVWANGGILGVNREQRSFLYGIGLSATAAQATAMPAGGCLGSAAATVAAGIGGVPELPGAKARQPGPAMTYYELLRPGLPMEIEQAAAREADSDPRVQAVAVRWKSCMAQSGFPYATPAAALGDPRWAPGTTDTASRRGSQERQVAVAVADARCQQQVNLAGLRLAVLAAYQEQLIGSNRGQLRVYEGEMARLVAQARQILASRQP